MLHSGVCMDRQYCAFARHRPRAEDHRLLRDPGRPQAGHARTSARTAALGSSTSIIERSTRRSASLTAAFESQRPSARPSNGLMVLDAVLASRASRGWPRSATSWRTSPGSSRSRLRREDLPHLAFGNGVETCVRYFPDKLPIGVADDGREHIFGYLVTRAAPVDFRAFLHRHAELLRALGRWAIRLWCRAISRGRRTPTNGRGSRSSRSPLRPSTADELRWFFAQRRDGRLAASQPRPDGSNALPPGSPGLQRTSVSRPLSSLAARGREHRRCDVFTGARRRHQPRHGPRRGQVLARVRISISPPWLARHESSS